MSAVGAVGAVDSGGSGSAQGPLLLLVNGPPGAGKSTVAALVAASRPGALCLEVDQIKHALGGWQHDPLAAGVQARRLALALVAQQLGDGLDVVLGQYLARTAFIAELDAVARRHGARFVECLLVLDEAALASRIGERRSHPRRPEHAVNNQLVAPGDAAALAASLADLPRLRPRTRLVDATGTPAEVAGRVELACQREAADEVAPGRASTSTATTGSSARAAKPASPR